MYAIRSYYAGTGDKAFCTGGNTKEYAEYYAGNPQEYRQYMRLFNDMVSAILACDKPVISRVNGMRIGGGQEIGMACDFTIAEDAVQSHTIDSRVTRVTPGPSPAVQAFDLNPGFVITSYSIHYTKLYDEHLICDNHGVGDELAVYLQRGYHVTNDTKPGRLMSRERLTERSGDHSYNFV